VLANKLKETLKRDEARNVGHGQTIAERKTEIETLFTQATELARQVGSDVTAEQNTNAERNERQARRYLERIEALVRSMELMLTRRDFDDLYKDAKSRSTEIEVSLCQEMTRLYYYQRNFTKAM